MIAYSARLDVPRELVRHVARLLRAERRAVGTRPGTRALTCFYQALLVLVWFRKGEDKTILGAGFGVSRATAYRYVAEAVRVLAAQTPTLHDALRAGRRRRLVARDPRRQAVRHRPARRDHHQRQRRHDRRLVLRETPRLRREHPGRHAPRRATDLDLGCDARTPARPDLRPAVWTSPAPCTGPPPHWTCRPWPTPATKALARASTPRTSSPPTAAASPSTTAPTTPPFDPCDASENAASRSSPAAGAPCVTAPPAPDSVGDIVRAALHLTHFEYRYLPESC